MSRTLVAAAALALLAGCASAASYRPRFVPLPPVAAPAAAPSGGSVGLVLTGGGAFGAWEIGALQAFFDAWHERHAEDPPVRVVAGTSTGALIAPFALLGRRSVEEAASWYTDVDQGDLLAGRLAALLPFPLFAGAASSAFSAGYPGPAGGRGSHLYRLLAEILDREDLARLAAGWPARRAAAVTLDFGTGLPDVFTNAPEEMALFRDGVFASAQVPLVMPPVPLPPSSRSEDGGPPSGTPARDGDPSPHLDGGVFAVAPLRALFDLAAADPPIVLTHVIVISPFPEFPGGEGAMLDEPFPGDPDFREIGDRMTTLLAEALSTKDLALARAAIALRRAGVAQETVFEATGLRIPGQPPELVEIMPPARLAWRALAFDRDRMRAMHERGYREARALLGRDAGGLTPLTSRH